MVCFILLSALLFAFNDVLFKNLQSTRDHLSPLFLATLRYFYSWNILFLTFKDFRKDFVSLITTSRGKIFVLNGISEFFYVLGGLISNFATLLAPVALIPCCKHLSNCVHFHYRHFIDTISPSYHYRKISRRHLFQRVLAIVVILIGSYFLYLD